MYVLEYADGTRYVGQAVDVVRRYAQHRHAGGPIEAVEFCPVPEADLDQVERAMIGHEEQRGPIRNHRHASEVRGPSKLDPVVTIDDQLAWLNGATALDNDEAGVRSDNQKQRLAGQKRFEELLAAPGAEVATNVLQSFLWSTVPRPRETERQFWAVSAMPSTNGGGRFATLSVGKLETMFLYLVPLDAQGWAALGGCVNVSASLVAPDVLDGTLDQPWAYVDRVGPLYESAGADLAGLRFVCTDDNDGYEEILGWPGVADAARTFAVRMMRKGLSLQGRWHNYPLADVLLGDVLWPWPLDSQTST